MAEFVSSPSAYQVKLQQFEGPLDLLLHLIKKSEVDIFNIPIASITDEYLAHLDMMRDLDVNVAGEFIVMAATLIYMKSKMLLPKDEKADPEEDPRADLVRQLLEYQQFKQISETFGQWEVRARDYMPREMEDHELKEEEFVEATLYDLLRAFQKMAVYFPQEDLREIARETFSVTQKMNEVLDHLEQQEALHWRWKEWLEELVEHTDALGTVVSFKRKGELIAMFLAVLELVRLKLARVMQSNRFGEIHLMRSETPVPESLTWSGEVPVEAESKPQAAVEFSGQIPIVGPQGTVTSDAGDVTSEQDETGAQVNNPIESFSDSIIEKGESNGQNASDGV